MKNLIGLVPAAGNARRLSSLPCSKEIFPIGFMNVEEEGQLVRRPKPVGIYLLEQLYQAGVKRVFIIINKEKSDILKYFGSGSSLSLSISYLVQEVQSGMPSALDQAYPWLQGMTILFGMPDTMFRPENAFSTLLATHERQKADVTLGLFPTAKPERFGMVSFSEDGRMIYTVDKPVQTDLKYMWGMAVWEPIFTEYLHTYLQENKTAPKEIVLGNVFQSALENGLSVCVHPFADGEYIDIGTISELNLTISRFSVE
jgi:glucose-1-phosphate thymidylyltransferase